jgi:hypothetical protein
MCSCSRPSPGSRPPADGRGKGRRGCAGWPFLSVSWLLSEQPRSCSPDTCWKCSHQSASSCWSAPSASCYSVEDRASRLARAVNGEQTARTLSSQHQDRMTQAAGWRRPRKRILFQEYNADAIRAGRPSTTPNSFGRALRRYRSGIQDGQRVMAGRRVDVWLDIRLRAQEPGYGDSGPSARQSLGSRPGKVRKGCSSRWRSVRPCWECTAQPSST